MRVGQRFLAAGFGFLALPLFAADPPKITSMDGTYGGNSVTVYFDKLPADTESATLTVKTCLEQKEHAFSAEELTAVKLTVSLDRGLFCNEDPPVDVTIHGKRKTGETVDVTLEKTLATPGKVVLRIDEPLKEGTKKITGSATGAPKIKIMVYGGWSRSEEAVDKVLVQARKDHLAKFKRKVTEALTEADQKRAIQNLETERGHLNLLRCSDTDPLQHSDVVAVANGIFTVTLDGPINEGDCIEALPVFAEVLAPERGMIDTRAAQAQSILLDWGRVRGYFSLGGMVSQYQQQFSQVNGFVGFTTDVRISGNVLDKDATEYSGSMVLKPIRWQLNAFADARVGVKLADTSSTPTTPPQTAKGVVAPPPASPPTQITYNATQPGFFQIGIHLPFSVGGMDWIHKGHQYSLFVGPILKAGGQTFDKDLVLSRRVEFNLALAEDAGRYTILANEARAGVLPFYGVGGRIGFFEYTWLGRRVRNRQLSNDLIGYLDFTYGKDRGMPSYTIQRTDLTGKLADLKTQDGFVNISSSIQPRYSIEGRLKIPFAPALIGVDANIRTNSRSDEPNLLRFVVAFRIDAQKALARVFGNIQ